MSRFDEYFSDKVAPKKSPSPVYTGALEKVTVQSDDKYHLHVLLHKGKVIAVKFGDRVLPFETQTLTTEQVKPLQEQYRKGLAGLIDRIVMRVAK